METKLNILILSIWTGLVVGVSSKKQKNKFSSRVFSFFLFGLGWLRMYRTVFLVGS